MKSVIGYARVSTRRQAEEGGSLAAQKLQIRQFAKDNKLKIRKIYVDVDSARNEDNGSQRPDFIKAMEHSLTAKWPIIAASFDRFTRTGATYVWFLAAGGRAYGAREGFGADEDVMHAAITRAEAEGKRISRNTRRGQAKAKEQGVPFGNPRIAEAQAASILARRANASKCRDEFRAEFFNAKIAGAVTDAAIVDFFNTMGCLSPQGRRWTRANFGRMRRELEAAGSPQPAGGLENTLIVGQDGWLTPSGFDRVRRVLAAKGVCGADLSERLYVVSGQKLTEATARQFAEKIEKKKRELRVAEDNEALWGIF